MDNFFAALAREEAKENENRLRSIFKKGKYTHALDESIDVVKILHMRKAGKTYREIANTLGCSPSTVRNKWLKIQSCEKEWKGH